MKESLKNIKFVWKYSKDQKGKLTLLILCNLVLMGISIYVPILSAKLITNLTTSVLNKVVMISIVLFVLEISRNLFHSFSAYFTNRIFRTTLFKMQTALIKDILKLQNHSVDINSSGLFIQRLTNDTATISDLFTTLFNYVYRILTEIGVLTAIFIINYVIGIYTVILLLVVTIYTKIFNKKLIELRKKYNKDREKTTGFIGELVRGIRDIKMLNSENSFYNKIENDIETMNNSSYSINNARRKFNFIHGGIHDLFDLLNMIIMVALIYHGKLTVTYALVLYNYSGRVLNISNNVNALIEYFGQFNVAATRVIDLTINKKFPKEKFGGKHIDKVNGDFEFKNVTFSYGKDKRKILDKINFKVNANETVAFVGKTGAGKTTIFNLLCKMYEVNSGKITIDKININELDKDSIRGNITIISQNPYIFNMSIKDNFKLVKEDVTMKEIKEACELACLSDFIEKLPHKYNTIIGEGGINLSGGEKQRLAIARALIQKTEIILFDEATSALDNETQSKIQKAIENMQGEYTIMIIAHRLSTIINSDRILFLNNGKIEAEGTHQKLLKTCKGYKELYESEIEK